MKKIFADTNILVDLLADRQPFSKYAIAIFDLAAKGKIKLFTSSHAYVTTHYLLKKHMSENDLRVILSQLLDFIELIPINTIIIRKSLLSKQKDFEDAVQIFAANKIEDLDFLVTRNLRDFKNSGLIVLSPDEVLNKL